MKKPDITPWYRRHPRLTVLAAALLTANINLALIQAGERGWTHIDAGSKVMLGFGMIVSALTIGGVCGVALLDRMKR